jgi:hypothetical protein
MPSIGRFMASNWPYVNSNYLSVVSSGLYMACNGINLLPGGLFMSCIVVSTSVSPNGLYERHQRGRQRILIFITGDPIYVLKNPTTAPLPLDCPLHQVRRGGANC